MASDSGRGATGADAGGIGSRGDAGGGTPDAATGPGSYWKPGPQIDWQWEIGNPLSLTSTADMGTSVTAYNGDTAPSDNPTVYDIDAILNPASTVVALHALGAHVICYVEVGTAGNYYSAADEGIGTTYYAQFQAAGVLGAALSGYPEYFLNINSAQTVSIVESMIKTQCADKGFDGVETDLDETYGTNEGTTGFTITQADEESYMTTLANFMHENGLAWVIKNPDDTGDSYASDMEPLAQLDLSEQCNQYGTCGALAPFGAAGKPVLNAEYSLSLSAFCPQDNATTYVNGRLFVMALNGASTPCR
jgi:hypothetical protein